MKLLEHIEPANMTARHNYVPCLSRFVAETAAVKAIDVLMAIEQTLFYTLL